MEMKININGVFVKEFKGILNALPGDMIVKGEYSFQREMRFTINAFTITASWEGDISIANLKALLNNIDDNATIVKDYSIEITKE